MRVVRVARRGDVAGESFDLHDQLTVIRGLRGQARAWFLESVGRLDASRSAVAVGEVESAGVVLPIEPETFELLGIDRAAEGVVDGRRLLGLPPDEVAASVRRAAAEVPAGDLPALPSEPVDPVDSWFNEPDHAAGGARAQEGGDDGGLLGLIDPVAAAADAGGGAAKAPRRTPIERRMEALRGRRLELEKLAEAITVEDLTEVAQALAVWDAAPTGVPIEEAAVLADAWRDLQKDLEGLELGASAEEKAALQAVERAREGVAEAEAALLVPRLTDEQMARIEAAHAAYIEASDKVERRFGGARARRQLAEAEAEEQRLLSRFGFESWVDFMITATKRTEDPEMTREHAALEHAREELEVCIAELDAIPGAVGRRHRRARLRETQEELSNKVARVLGHEPVGDDVESELRNVKAPYDPVTEAAGLERALKRAGVDVSGLRKEPVRLAAKAQHVLAVQAQAEKRRAELLVAIEALSDALIVLEEAAAAGATEPPDMPPLPDMAEPPVGFVERFEDDGSSVAVAAEPAPGSPADGSADEPESGSDPETDGEQEADDPAPEAGAVGGAAGAGGHDPGSDDAPESADDLEVFLVAAEHKDREALLDEVHWEAMTAIADLHVDGPAGQLPVVFDDPFAVLSPDECVELLSRLVRLTDYVQMVIVSDRPEVAEWAQAIGSDHARVLEASR